MARATVIQLIVGTERAAPAATASVFTAGPRSEIQLKGSARWIPADAVSAGGAGGPASDGVAAIGGAAGRIRSSNTDDVAVGVVFD